MITVVDSSPLIALAEIGQLDLFTRLYQEVWIPTAVWKEVVVRGRDPLIANAIRSAQWLRVADAHDRTMVRLLRQHADEGESEAIALAITLNAGLLIIDDARGRRIAATRGIPTIGAVGTLVVAKRRGLVDLVEPLLVQLRDTGFHMHSELMSTALRLADED